jgi:CheY-like chemotaxis protein
MAFQVLVVDDAAFVRDAIKRNLRALIPNVEIFDAPDGRRACSVVKSKNIKLILSDWEMPEMSGEEFLTWLRSQDEHAKTPFIMVTSRGDKEHVVTAVKAGVNDYITKPFTPDELQKKVLKQLKRIGFKGTKEPASQSGGAFSSLDVLTGGDKKPKKAAPTVTAAAGFGKPQPKAQKKAAPAASKSRFKGEARIRFAKHMCALQVRDMNLQGLVGVIDRPELMPTVFDQATVDLVDASGAPLAEVNAYVHGLTAQQTNPQASQVMVNIRFVDNDPQKFEALSKAIAR